MVRQVLTQSDSDYLTVNQDEWNDFNTVVEQDRLLCNMTTGHVPSKLPKDQFVTDVTLPYGDFLATPSLEHRAKAAVNAFAHFAEHVFVYYRHHDPSVLVGTEKAADFVSYLARTEQCEELDIFWDLALAGKHRFLTHPASRQRHISSDSDALMTDPLVASATAAFVPGATSPLRLKLGDGRQPLIADVLEAVIRFW